MSVKYTLEDKALKPLSQNFLSISDKACQCPLWDYGYSGQTTLLSKTDYISSLIFRLQAVLAERHKERHKGC